MHPTTLPDSGNTHDPYDIGFYTNQFIFKDYPKYFICNAYFHDDAQLFPILMHNHSFYEINIVTSGSGWHYIENQCIKAKLGSVFVIPPNVRHGYYTEDPHSFKIFHILLSSYFMENTRKNWKVSKDIKRCLKLSRLYVQTYAKQCFSFFRRTNCRILKKILPS